MNPTNRTDSPLVLRWRLRRLLEASWAEEALRASEKKHRSVVENLSI